VADASFSVVASRLLEDLMERMEAVEALEDADIDLVDGILTVEFDDGSQIILNRQEAAQQIWLVSPLGPAHFDLDAASGRWRDDRTGADLTDILESAFSARLGQPVRLS